MKRFLLAGLLACSSHVFAQLSVLPPSFSSTGATVQPLGGNAGAAHWENSGTLGAYRYSSDGTQPFLTGNMDGMSRVWATQAPAAALAARSAVALNGGVVRVIFLGETAGWLNDFGFSYSGNPTGPGSYTLWENIQSNSATPNVKFGDHYDIGILPGSTNFDFWLNASGTVAADGTGSLGGVYTAFDPTKSQPFVGAGNVLWDQTPVPVSTTVSGADLTINTYLFSFEDWRLGSADMDRSDLLLGLQFFGFGGTPFDNPVPEPSTYGWMGAAALVALITARRLTNKNKNISPV